VSPRLTRARRLIEVAESEEGAARSRAAAADRALAVAREGAEQAEATWLGAAREGFAAWTRSTELEDKGAFLRTLRTRADAAGKLAADAAIEQQKRASAVVRAATERRKLELWRDKIASHEAEEEARKDRIATDEMAARLARRVRS
jgi:hypothetical protein